MHTQMNSQRKRREEERERDRGSSVDIQGGRKGSHMHPTHVTDVTEDLDLGRCSVCGRLQDQTCHLTCRGLMYIHVPSLTICNSRYGSAPKATGLY